MQNHYLKAWMVLPLAVALAVAVAALASLASAPAEAAGKFKTVTKTFVRPAEIAIPSGGNGAVGPADPYPATRNVGGFPKGAKIVDVNLALRGFNHTGPTEVDMMLVHAGVNRTVMSDAGGGLDADNLLITLDDEAQAQLPSEFLDPLSSGRFRPANFDGIDDPNDTLDDSFPEPAPTQNPAAALKGFDGKNPEGAWRLFIDDQSNSGTGELSDGYALKIKAKFRP